MIRVKSTTPTSKDQSRNRTPASFARSTPPAGLRARGRRGEVLSSVRDRQRLRERNTAERERVEVMLASPAILAERRARRRESAAPEFAPRSPRFELRALQPSGCPVCGDARIVTDEVMHGGTLRVSECLNCEHRWTQRPKQGRWAELGATMRRASHPRTLRAVESRTGSPDRRSA